MDLQPIGNQNEWRAGTIPIDSNSLLQILTSANAGSGIKVSCQRVGNRSYFLERASDLSLPSTFQLVKSNLIDQAGMTSYTDTNAIGTGPFFYRVGVQ